MKTEALEAGARQVRLRRGDRRRAARRGKEPRQGAGLFASRRRPCLGPAAPAPGTLEPLQHPARARRDRCGSSRCRTGPNSTCGTTSRPRSIPVVPLYFAKPRPVVERDGVWIMVDDDRLPLRPGETPRDAHRALPHARLLSADRRDRVRRRDGRRHRRRTAPRRAPPSGRAG